MAADVGGLVADIGLNVAGLRQDIKRANTELARGTNKMNRKLGSLQRSFRSVTRGFQALIGIGIGFQFGRMAADIASANAEIDKFGKLVDRLGGSTEAFSELQFVAERSGVAFNAMTMGLQRMQRRVAEAAVGTGEAKGALQELNLSAEQLSNLDIDVQFELIADALSSVEKQSDQTRLAMKLFDSEGVSLLQTMERGADGIRELRQQAIELGVSLSRDQVDAATQATDAVTNMNAAFSALGRTIAVETAPALTSLANQMRISFGGATLQEQIDQFSNQLKVLLEAGRRPDDTLVQFTIKQLQELGEELDKTRAKIKEAPLAEIAVSEKNRGFDMTALIERSRDELDAFTRSFETAEQKAGRLLATLNRFKTQLPEGEFDRIRDEILQPLMHEEIDVEPLERSVSLVDKFGGQLEKANGLATELGLTFSSAFEDAIVMGNGLRSVLQGLLQDLLRLFVRQTVTGPLLGFFGGLFGGTPAPAGFAGGLGGAVPGARGLPFGIPGSGGFSKPGFSSTTVINIDARSDREQIIAEITPVLERNNQNVIAQVQAAALQDRLI